MLLQCCNVYGNKFLLQVIVDVPYCLQVDNFVEVDVPVDSEEWATVTSKFHNSLSREEFTVIRVSRIQVRGYEAAGSCCRITMLF